MSRQFRDHAEGEICSSWKNKNTLRRCDEPWTIKFVPLANSNHNKTKHGS